MVREHRRATAHGAFISGLAAALIVLAASAGSAQDVPPREGQWIGVGLGGGIDRIMCDICRSTPRPGVSGYLRFGGTVSPSLLLGGEFNAWTRSDEGARQIIGALQAVAYWYPDPDGRFYLKGGVGAVGFRSEAEGDALRSLDPGIQAGTGIEYPIGAGLSMTPFVNFILAPFSTLTFNGDVASSGATVSMLQAGVGLTWH